MSMPHVFVLDAVFQCPRQTEAQAGGGGGAKFSFTCV